MGKWHETQEAYFGQTDSFEENTGRVLPILFNTEMVRAILDGRKTVTRRVMKPQPLYYTGRRYIFADECCPKKWEDCDNIIETYQYQPGDTLYVRETFAWEPCWDCGMDTEEHNCCDESAHKIYNHKKHECGCYMYKASVEDNVYPSVDTWHPSIHMPKEAARIWLKVTDVRVELLQGIVSRRPQKTVHNICAEGLRFKAVMENYDVLINDFKSLWDSTVKHTQLDIYGWGANPLVWVIEFERCEKPTEVEDEKS